MPKIFSFAVPLVACVAISLGSARAQQSANPQSAPATKTAQEDVSSPSKFDKTAIEQLKGKTVTWEGVVKDGSILVSAETNSDYSVNCHVALNQKDGDKVTVSGKVGQAYSERVAGREGGKVIEKVAVVIFMEGCTVRSVLPAPETKPQAQASPDIPGLPTQKDKVSYAIGVNLGKGLSHDSIDVDPNLIMQGLKDGLGGSKTLMTDEQVQATIVQLESQVREQIAARRQQDAVTNKKAGDAFMAANKTKPGVVALPSGLQYKILKEGTGPKPTTADIVSCNYRGTTLNGKEFDSSYSRGEPTKFPVQGVIKGWTEALQLMPVGSKWELYVPPDLAYDERGAGSVIGPNETLIFEVELLAIEPPSPPPGTQPPAAKP